MNNMDNNYPTIEKALAAYDNLYGFDKKEFINKVIEKYITCTHDDPFYIEKNDDSITMEDVMNNFDEDEILGWISRREIVEYVGDNPQIERSIVRNILSDEIALYIKSEDIDKVIEILKRRKKNAEKI